MKSVLFFASPSMFARTAVETKAAFLSLLVERLNRDEALLQRFSSVSLYKDELAREPRMGWSPRDFDPLGLEKLEDGKRTLLQNVMPLLDSDHKRSSFSLVCRLSCLTPLDLETFFLDMSVLFCALLVPGAERGTRFPGHGFGPFARRHGNASRSTKKVLERGSQDRYIDEQESRRSFGWPRALGSAVSSSWDWCEGCYRGTWRRTADSSSSSSSTGRRRTCA
jgi:hypothetical protein